jgi:hypothetical protein
MLHDYSTIIPLLHLHSTMENYSKTPQNGEIIPSGDPGWQGGGATQVPLVYITWKSYNLVSHN